MVAIGHRKQLATICSIRDPYDYVDGSHGLYPWSTRGWSCGTDETQSDYLRVNFCAIAGEGLIPRLHPGGNDVWSSDEEYEVTRRIVDYGLICEDTAHQEAAVGPHKFTSSRCGNKPSGTPILSVWNNPCYRGGNGDGPEGQIYKMFQQYKNILPVQSTLGKLPPPGVPSLVQ